MADHDADHDAGANEDEDNGAQIAPIIHLEEVAVITGEEDEDAILDLRAKLYRFDKDGNQWKERGTGNVKLLRHTETGKVRILMRQAKTLKICANHYVSPTIKIQDHLGNEKSCVWHARDYSDGELKKEVFCIRFGSVENNRMFMDTVEGIAAALLGNIKEAAGNDAALLGNNEEAAGNDAALLGNNEEAAGNAAALLGNNEEAVGNDAAATPGLLEELLEGLTVGEGTNVGEAPRAAEAELAPELAPSADNA